MVMNQMRNNCNLGFAILPVPEKYAPVTQLLFYFTLLFFTFDKKTIMNKIFLLPLTFAFAVKGFSQCTPATAKDSLDINQVNDYMLNGCLVLLQGIL